MNNGIALKFSLKFISRKFCFADKFTVARPGIRITAKTAFYFLFSLRFIKYRTVDVNKIAVRLVQNNLALFFAPDITFAVNIFDLLVFH